ncbi:hypothetical protein SERLA73DRAFT_107794 [Serpula lacrymans var. lacrymans S7.3]|uniref:Molybdopterin synthase sulfur carrier subunit n=2 Tax=Serpula lacrymans var. lacrymans TaxID=341189 RepID=F8PXT4_SERL3|nr:uncharacterized protein SERLADRAFT_389293 [Serpula lacrymans var. lacrymans S7.9]EGN98697.1 hypothetical protein SERLA73DRAFT_107794 [Serpula lacrymans var. lacrymans S7.3]EGO24302.1 hypothetical protein SERLADRAFT_389293 [Serpula lacrymans var. lacrymans S7.9]
MSMSQIEVTVLYFAAASTAVGLTEERVALQPSFHLNALGDHLISLHPNCGLDKVLQSSQWSVDAEMVEDVDQVVLKGGEEIAIICPVSGG